MSQTLNKAELRRLLDRVRTSSSKAKPVEVDVASLRLRRSGSGGLDSAARLKLIDPHNDAVAIILEGIDVTISQPREIHFDGVGSHWNALDIRDAQGVQHVVELKEPLLLPAPAQRQARWPWPRAQNKFAPSPVPRC